MEGQLSQGMGGANRNSRDQGNFSPEPESLILQPVMKHLPKWYIHYGVR
jgi:hypothetical protein